MMSLFSQPTEQQQFDFEQRKLERRSEDRKLEKLKARLLRQIRDQQQKMQFARAK